MYTITAQYEIAKYLNTIITPCIPSQYMLQSTSSFMDKLKLFKFKPSHVLVSYDVVSLFTNIPLKKTIDIICDYVYSSSNSKPSYSRQTFKRLLEIATGGYFLYKGKLFCQVDGVTMGSPLGPTFANIFLAHFENQFMKTCLDFKPELYLRYVDDIFCVFSSVDYVTKFLDFLNSLQPENLKFTYEIGKGKIAFLDTDISLPSKTTDTFSSEVYRKPTNTGVILNFTALCPINWKTGLIMCFLHRAYLVCSSWTLFHNEVSKLSDMFVKNGYPKVMIDNCVGKFLNRKIDTQPKIDNDNEEKYYMICLPYLGYISDNFKKQIRQTYKKLGIKVRVVFRSFRVGNYFSLKDKTPFSLKAKVIYQFTGSCDESISYVGKTKRHLAIRKKEHFQGNSAIFEHISVCESCKFCNLKNFKILNTGRTDFELKIKEALYIKMLKPTLNNQLIHKGSEIFLNVF